MQLQAKKMRQDFNKRIDITGLNKLKDFKALNFSKMFTRNQNSPMALSIHSSKVRDNSKMRR